MQFPSPEIQRIELLPGKFVQVLRLDRLDEHISGNKWYKLKYNIERAEREGYAGLLTFGGVNSNHLAAAAAACNRSGLRSTAIIRAGELNTPTLVYAKEQGMDLRPVSREEYALRNSQEQQTVWKREYPDLLLVPEGGANADGVKGASEIMADRGDFDYLCCACGTGTTFLGLVASSTRAKVLGFSVLKGENTLPATLRQSFPEIEAEWGDELDFEAAEFRRHAITNRYSEKGYAGFWAPVFEFSADLYQRTGLLLDHVYTSRVFFGVADLLRSGKIKPSERILIVHSGGLQGNSAFEARYGLQSFAH